MALLAIETVLRRMRNASEDDIRNICNTVVDLMNKPGRSSEFTAMLRQLFVMLQSSESDLCVPTGLIVEMLRYISNPDTDKIGGRQCTLCGLILKELLVGDSEGTLDSIAPSDKTTSHSFLLSLYSLQVSHSNCIREALPLAVRWLCKKDFETQVKTLSFIVAVSSLHGIVSQDIMAETSEQLCNWLMNASLYQAPNPHALNPFRKDASSQVTEIDGTPCRNVFTVLNVGQYYMDDQYLNIYSFSLLYKWLHHCTFQTPEGGERSASGEDTQTTKLQGVSRVLQSLVSRSVDYCFRIMDQCERKARVSSDGELQLACQMEVVIILDLVCKLDAGHLPRVHQEMRQLYTRLMSDPAHSPTVLRILQFFLNHSASVVHDPQEAYNHFFSTLLPDHFGDPGLAFDTVVFLVNNMEVICYNTNIFSQFFPSILKIFAWLPQTFLKEFVSLLPAMMYPTTALEVFHTLLDMPCVTAALEVMEKAKKSEVLTIQGTSAEPATSLEAFHTPQYRPMFSFITRSESGQGDTISKLSSLHKVLEDMRSIARVVYCSQTIPLLLKVWFDVVLEDAEEGFAAQLLPVMLERSGLLFDLADFKADVVLLLGEKLLLLLKKFPRIMINQATDIMEFITMTSNMQGRQDFYGNLVYAVGEYCSPAYAQDCSPELVAQYFDSLEVVTYEVIGKVLVEEEEAVSPKILCHLMSAMAKLSTRCHDLIPRAILCLTKVAKQHYTLTQDSVAQEAMVSCAQEHINLLRMPNFAMAVLSPSPEIYTGRWHQDKFSLPVIVRGMHRLMVSSS